jgi:hypothetical protein
VAYVSFQRCSEAAAFETPAGFLSHRAMARNREVRAKPMAQQGRSGGEAGRNDDHRKFHLARKMVFTPTDTLNPHYPDESSFW